MTHLILVVEEDPATRSFLAYNLTADGYEVAVAEDRRHAFALLAARRPQLVLVDLNGQTLGLLDAVRKGDGLAGEVDPETPIIVLTDRADELSRVRVFNRGGDDVVSKPFSYPERRGRVRALLRRSYAPRHAPVARVGTVTVDHRTREVRVGEQPVMLAAKEFALLQTLIADPSRVFTKHELMRDLWGYPAETRSRTLDSHAARLRRKLDAAGAGRRTVVCVWGIGYRFCDGPPVGPGA
jgi:DNA-binding response OmpR family regulator